MAALILDPSLERQLKRERALTGADRFDEVWDGVYVLAPAADIEHSDVTADLLGVLRSVARSDGLGECFPAVNISDRKDGWRQRQERVTIYV